MCSKACVGAINVLVEGGWWEAPRQCAKLFSQCLHGFGRVGSLSGSWTKCFSVVGSSGKTETFMFPEAATLQNHPTEKNQQAHIVF